VSSPTRNIPCIQALLCPKFRLNLASRNVYFEILKISGNDGFLLARACHTLKLANKKCP
jgi:hypothetical protein